ncbi:FAD-binding oxidoreductase [Kaistia dalseonensis]|uniref:Gamma-glutamylputrescine oxidase n=1 Tax=Kaistia dalseonensis TaxID=410840 RepID=A0ABU0H890_9HYPH|nr:FAD-binding oxidoreductase [Kaistia dalseonensis]MCX5495927.1 FAD-binding oxidoreductase [Kaistia dalseonensis]MDQ0438530.1 gamma-glutamylputrescine oxidase [Kaistia dalseonensis]
MTQPHAPSWYAATADQNLTFPPLDGDAKAHVAIIGGGFTGLSCALHLAEAGIDVVLIEAEKIGWGASGRNGGQLHTGQRRDQDWLERHLGRPAAHELWGLAEESKALVMSLIERHGIDAEWRPGLIEAVHKQRLVAEERHYVEKLNVDYGYSHAEWIERDRLPAMIGSDGYYGGRLDRTAGHLHPLKFAQGLARAAQKAGARIHEGTGAIRLDKGKATVIETGRGRITADIVVLAGNGLLDGIDEETETSAMPIKNYILTTEPIGAGEPGGLIPGGEAVSDSRFVVYYWRPTPDGRILFGGGETYSRRDPADIVAFVRAHLLKIYPKLANARIDYGWGGTLAVTVNRLPFLRRLKTGVYAASGYSGQGVALAPFGGKVIAEAILGDPGKLDRFAALPCPRFPGGKLLRWPALVAGMSWYALRDRI